MDPFHGAKVANVGSPWMQVHRAGMSCKLRMAPQEVLGPDAETNHA